MASSLFIKERGIFPKFTNWQDGYGAFTYSMKEKENLVAYIRNQEAHHEKITFRDEYVSLLREHEVNFDERYLL